MLEKRSFRRSKTMSCLKLEIRNRLTVLNNKRIRRLYSKWAHNIKKQIHQSLHCRRIKLENKTVNNKSNTIMWSQKKSIVDGRE